MIDRSDTFTRLFFDIIVLVLWVLIGINNICFFPLINMPDNKRYQYIGELVSEETYVTKIDSVTRECTKYVYYVRYVDEQGDTCCLKSTKDDGHYEIRTDGKSYVYNRTTRFSEDMYTMTAFFFNVILCICLGGAYNEEASMTDLVIFCIERIKRKDDEDGDSEVDATDIKGKEKKPPFIIR